VRILLVGGIFGKPADYRRTVTSTPETVLAEGLRGLGHHVDEQGHARRLHLSGYDVVHVHHLAAGAVAAASARPVERIAFTAHWLRHADRRRRLAMRYVIGRALAVVALSDTEAGWQRSEYREVGARQYVIPNGIDPNIFRFIPAQPPDAGEPWRLLFVGQLARVKGVEFLLHALALLNQDFEVELNLVYQVDTEETDLRRAAQELELQRVRFLGARSPAELADLYAETHVFVLPSTGEALPSVISEAIFVGRPVVATDVGAVSEQVGNFGAVVPPRDPAALARAIADVLNDYDRYTAMGRENHDRVVSRYSIEAMVAAHEDMYLGMLALPTPVRSVRQDALDVLARAALGVVSGNT
jgi:glycosyltransferase involved in cell wall biosynthesis